MKILIKMGFLILMIIYSGCAVGRKMNYTIKEVKPDYTVSKNILTLFQDKRPEVLDGTEKPSWCGHTYSTLQISYNIQTKSGKPLAEEFTASMENSFIKQGIKVIGLPVNMNTSLDSIQQVFGSSKMDRLVLFTLNKWESSAIPRFSDIHYELDFNIDLEVYDQAGIIMAKTNVHDNVSKNQDIAVSLKRLQEMADEVFIIQVRNLLNDDAVKSSLK